MLLWLYVLLVLTNNKLITNNITIFFINNLLYRYSARNLHTVALALEENIDAYPPGTSVVILPPENACECNTDEDSGEEDDVHIHNLPGSQLRAEAEIIFPDEDSDFDSDDDNIPLSLLLPQRKEKPKRQKIFSWKKEDIPNNVNEPEWTDVQGPKTNFSPTEIFFSFLDDEILTMMVEETNRYAAQKNLTGDVSHHEMKCFIGVLLLSGYNIVPRRNMYKFVGNIQKGWKKGTI